MTLRKSPTLLLINPWIYDFAAYDSWAKPLGFLYLASILRKNGYEIRYLDCLNSEHPELKGKIGVQSQRRKREGKGKFLRTIIEKPEPLRSVPRYYSRYGIPLDVFIAELRNSPEPAAILVTSGMTYWYPGVFEVIRLAKGIFPRVPLILGGIYATLCRSHAEKYSGADFILSGTGEIQSVRLVSSLTCREASFLPDPENPDSLPYPALDLVNPLHYVCILTSRGCPYRCQYCAASFLMPVYRPRNPPAVADEMEMWSRTHGILNFAFYDDALLWQPEGHFVPLMKEIIRRGITCFLHASNGINVRGISEDIAALMREAGFATIRLGLETADDDRMNHLGGKTSRQEFTHAIRNLRRAGFQEDQLGVFLLVGLPDQKADEVEESIRFVRDCGAQPILAEYSPIPETALWQEAVRTSPFDIVHEPLFHNNSILPCQGDDFTYEDLTRLKHLARFNVAL